MKTIALATLLLSSLFACSQKLISRNAEISFFSTTPVENIDAKNNTVLSILDQSTGQLVFSVTVKDFKFKDQLMQDHFNEKYLESSKYPKSQFDGKINNLAAVDFTKDGEYDVSVSGKLTMHGVTKDITTQGKIIVKDKVVKAVSTFKLKLVDYHIEVPTIVFNKIAEEIDVTVNLVYEPYK